ncbi:MAG: hypothetical protein Q9M43_14740 [Sulfurimonas sp.]|nr:hypothetical protein [Candidatus Dojkabacteria bacterium]MDQ7062300.1 hypothetical protein [Sulfurimonas sp.]
MDWYYKDITSNSFNLGITNSNKFFDSSSFFFSSDVSKNIKIIKEEIYTIMSHYKKLILPIFDAKYYDTQAKIKWVPLLCRNTVIFDITIYVKQLKDAIEFYIFIFSFREVVVTMNKGNLIIGKNFNSVSALSPLFNYLDKIVFLNKSEFIHIFISIIKEFCNFTDQEIIFFINKLTKNKVSTFKNNEAYLPKVDKKLYIMYCDIFNNLKEK